MDIAKIAFHPSKQQREHPMSNQSDNQSWFIVGHGAIGLLWAKSLSVSNPVNLILRQPKAYSAQPKQIQFDYTFTDIKQQKHPLTLNTSNLNALKLSKTVINKLLIPVKAYDVQPALTQLLPLLSDTCTIVLCHNGMGTIEQAQSLLKPGQSLYFATTTHGAYKPNQHAVKHTGLGETKIGLIQNKHSLAASTNLLPPTNWQQNITHALWSKLAINCAINPLTAIHNCKNGDLAQSQYRQVLTEICEEFSQVANKALVNTTNNQAFNSQALLAQCLDVIAATADNYSSMHQDVHHRRTSEIDYITGFVINQAKALNLSVPTHQLIYRQFCDITSDH